MSHNTCERYIIDKPKKDRIITKNTCYTKKKNTRNLKLIYTKGNKLKKVITRHVKIFKNNLNMFKA